MKVIYLFFINGMIMLDLQKAFDMVDHELLCKKLKDIGIRNVEWLKS